MAANLISDEVVMTESGGQVMELQLDSGMVNDEVVLYKCEDCGNLFSSWELVQAHLNGSTCPAAKRVEIPQPSINDGSFLIMQPGARGTKRMITPPEPVAKRGRPKGRLNKPKDPNIFREPFPADPIFTCNFCGAAFKSSNGLDAHVEIHQKQTDIACDVCHTKFPTLRELKVHRALHTGKERDLSLICDVCGDEFTTKSLLKGHMADRHAAELAYVCEFCEAAYLTNTELDIHLTKCPEKREYRPPRDSDEPVEEPLPSSRFTCGICDKMFKTIGNLTRHIHKFHQEGLQNRPKTVTKSLAIEEQIPCGMCYELFDDLEGLQDHECMALPSGTEISTYTCNVCSDRFVGETFLELHTYNHSAQEIKMAEEKQNGADSDVTSSADKSKRSSRNNNMENDFHYCKKCGQIFLDLDRLNNHINDVHFGPNPLECQVCREVFLTKLELENHKPQHGNYDKNSSKYVCNICPRQFVSVGQLTDHQNRHRSEKPYQCNTCDQWYATSAELLQHQADVHPELNQDNGIFQCFVCDKVLKSKEALNTHSRIHTGERPYQCQHCPKSFKRKSEIDQHQAVHTGERPYVCKVCGKSFRYRNNLDTHKHVHGEKPFPCEFCDHRFIKKSLLLQHQRHYHPGMVSVADAQDDVIDEVPVAPPGVQNVEIIAAGGDGDQAGQYVLHIADGDTIDAAALIAQLGSVCEKSDDVNVE